MTHRKQILCVKLVTLFSIIALFSSSAFAADAADEHASKEATSGAYIVLPNGGRMDMRLFLKIRRDLIPYIELGLRASDKKDDTTTKDDEVEICDLGACECLCKDAFNDLMTRCLLASDPDACCKIDTEYCQ